MLRSKEKYRKIVTLTHSEMPVLVAISLHLTCRSGIPFQSMVISRSHQSLFLFPMFSVALDVNIEIPGKCIFLSQRHLTASLAT